MKLKSLYESLLNEKKQTQNPLSNEVFDRLVKELDQPGKWFEAMAVCEAALDVGLVNDNVQKLRREMFVNGKELHSGATLNETDYIDWFAQVVDFNKKLIDAGIDEAWVELGSIYLNARYPFRDIKKAEQYMLEGVKLNDPLALAYYGYHHYFGIGNISVNKEEGKKMMLKAQELGFAKAIAYLLTTKFDTDTDLPTYEKEILQYSASVKPADQLWHLLGNVYRDKEQNLSKALEAYEKGIELADDPYCKYQKAVLILTEKTEGDFDEALAMMKDASEWNIIYAMSFLGQFYCFNEQYLNIEKAIEWYKKAISYCDVSAMVNLALVYLYNEDYQDIDKGLKYLDRAIEQNELRAMNEKGHFLLENSERNEINQAKILLEKACEMGDEYAPFRLGVGYQNAEFQETYEYKKAYEYYILAAERNNLHAIELLGRYCRMGLTGEANPEKTIEYFQRAIDMDSNYARVELAICYEDGFGVEQDSHKAFELLKKAADNDYPYAHSKLGGYYMNGVATEKNLDLAFEHF